ncbi:SDR family NAD(P)-dependent oxidoreductase [uncultured Castellaniella sp.]|uniref:SDR family NAD(P)-dependent oxidoreductase n=1 Tax=uncultured Castellaniella sp. TaxID=647907 RepID=UPI00261C994B|nr:SDR family NAD(P)-dependent oxidoreductase [uncultured Castellaniella sp.]
MSASSHRLALVTGASAGFGRAIATALCRDGWTVIGAARRQDRLREIQRELGTGFHPLELDVTSPASIERAAAQVEQEFPAGLDLLVNNAGLALGVNPAHQADVQDWESMIQTNVMGLSRMVHRFLPGMVARDRGHVVNIGSVAGNYAYPGGNVYGATKAFVKQFSLGLRADLYGTRVRVTNIEPGLVGGTEFSQVRLHGDQTRAAAVYENVEALQPEDVAEAVLWAASQPARVNINIIEIMPVAQSLVGTRLYRKP